jgi:uncharacterized repeat protein (TIGR03803 family)
MDKPRLLLCCAILFGCSRGAVGSVPVAPNANGEASTSGAAPRSAALVTPPDRGAVTFTSLYSFKGLPDGEVPIGGLILFDGALYGTTKSGGSGGRGCGPYGCGAIVRVTLTGTETVLHSFTAYADGYKPFGGLTNVNGILYGTTEFAGAGSSCCGMVFKITLSGKKSAVYDFQGGSDGAGPTGTLLNVGGTLYGTTVGDGAGGNCGTVFKVLAHSPALAGTERALYGFKGGTGDGCNPLNAPLIELNGTLYGTTYVGGGQGVVFSVNPSGVETVLHKFGGGSDGVNPIAGLVALNGTLYGTTYQGGANGVNGGGTVFAITPSGTETVLHSFGTGADGVLPSGGLTALNGTLYGTTAAGGTNGQGTLFSITPSGTETVLHNFTGADRGEPSNNLIFIKGTFYGTTEIGGSANFGTVFSLAL